jgi:hypothetical protein
MRLFAQVREQGGDEADGSEEICGDDRFGIGYGGLIGSQLFRPHDSRVVDESVERREFRGNPRRELADTFGFSISSGAARRPAMMTLLPSL